MYCIRQYFGARAAVPKGSQESSCPQSSLSTQPNLKATPSLHSSVVQYKNQELRIKVKEKEYTIRYFREKVVGCCVLQKYENTVLFFGLGLWSYGMEKPEFRLDTQVVITTCKSLPKPNPFKLLILHINGFILFCWVFLRDSQKRPSFLRHLKL